MGDELSAPPPEVRRRAFSTYFFRMYLRSHRRLVAEVDPFVVQHHQHAVAAVALLLILMVIGALVALVDAWLTVTFEARYYPPCSGWVTAGVLLLGVVAVLGLEATCAWQAHCGKPAHVYLLSRVARMPRVLAWARWTGLAVLAGLMVVGITAVHATTIAPPLSRSARVVLLYDDLGYVPRWVFCLGFYRVSLAARDRWGDGAASVEPLTVKSLQWALMHADFVFVASHGHDGLVCLSRPGVHFSPTDVEWLAANIHSQLVYLSACGTPEGKAAWEQALAPARVRAFGRDSAVLEHIYWLFLSGPAEVAGLSERASDPAPDTRSGTGH